MKYILCLHVCGHLVRLYFRIKLWIIELNFPDGGVLNLKLSNFLVRHLRLIMKVIICLSIFLLGSGNVFDYYIDSETKKFEPWTKIVHKFTLEEGVPLQSVLVNTNETTRIRYFIDLLLENGLPIMRVGSAGTGKTVLMKNKFNSLSPEDWLVVSVPFNYYTTSELLQQVMEKHLERKAGRNYGPPGSKVKLIDRFIIIYL